MLKRLGTLPRLRLGFRRSGFKALAVAAVLIAASVAGLQASAAAVPNSAIVVDSKSGKVLYSSNPDALRHPASLTKMMTLYLLFEAIDSGKSSLDSAMPVSAYAAAQAPSKLGLKPGQMIRVRDGILAIVTKSANDVAVVIAEYLGGSEKNFSALMTKRAHQIGMSRTTFVNASGLPANAQITTARDMATLGRALREHFPQYYSYFSTPSFVWQGRRIANHNRLLGRIDGVNGIKTGYTRASGYNLVTSVERGNRMIVGVVLGGSSTRARDKRMAGLIDDYLPQATRGVRTAKLIPGGPDASDTVADATTRVASNAILLPRQRPMDLAAIASGNDGDNATDDDADDASDTTTVAAAGPVVNAASTTDSAQAAPPFTASVASVIGANSLFALDANNNEAPQGDTNAGDETADATPPPAERTGWRIQVAAAPTQSGAEDILDRALAKGAKVLAHAAPYTEPVQSGATTLYRARFAGFTSKEAARTACAYLVKQQFSCLAISN